MTDFKGQHICPECESDEIPLSTIETGQEGVTDYFFSCSKCDFSWYLRVREGVSVRSDPVGFMDEDGNLSWERGE